MKTKPKAVVLLSGGLDSTTALAIATSEGFVCYALSFRYGQRHAVEINRARSIAAQSKVAQLVIANIDLRAFGGSALTANIKVPKARHGASGRALNVLRCASILAVLCRRNQTCA